MQSLNDNIPIARGKSFLDQFIEVEADTRLPSTLEKKRPVMSIPSPEELQVLDERALANRFIENNRMLCAYVAELAPDYLPYFGLHGSRDPDCLKKLTNDSDLYLQFVTVLRKSLDPPHVLADVYDVVGGNLPYFARPDHVLLVCNLEKNGSSIARRWGGAGGGELKNWRLAQVGIGISRLRDFFEKNLGLSLEKTEHDIFSYFEENHPHAEKSGVSFQDQSLSERLSGHIDANSTPLHLLRSIDRFSSPKNHVRSVIAEMIYVQYVVNEIIQMVRPLGSSSSRTAP